MTPDALLAEFAPIDRTRPRRTNNAELLSFAGVSRHGLRRLVEAGAIACERADAPPRKDGRRGASRIFVTLADVARWRAARYTPENGSGAVSTVSAPGRPS